MEKKNTIPTIRYYWRSSKRGTGQVRAYLNEGGRKSYGGVTGCFITAEEWAQLNTDGSLKDPTTASEELKAVSRMLEDLRFMFTSIELKIASGWADVYFHTFNEEMQYCLSNYLKQQFPRKNDVSAIISRIMSNTNESAKGEV